MDLLLDTHVFLWWDRQDPALNEDARDAIEDPLDIVFVSAASVWEIAIKRRLGKLTFHGSAASAVRTVIIGHVRLSACGGSESLRPNAR